jgi:hypothetical protein
MAPARRLEDRIRELCIRVANAKNEDFVESVRTLRTLLNEFTQLQMALSDLMRRTESKTAASLLSWPEFPRDRRHA